MYGMGKEINFFDSFRQWKIQGTTHDNKCGIPDWRM